MFMENRISGLRENRQMLQCHLSAALDIDNLIYCIIERGDRRAKKEQIPLNAEILQTDSEKLLALWLVDQVRAVVGDDKQTPDKVLDIAKQKLNG